MKLTGKQSWVFEHKLYVNAEGTAAGPKEKEGPIGHLIDKTYDEMHCDQKNWEMAERKLMDDAISTALSKANLQKAILIFCWLEIYSTRTSQQTMWQES